jgi:acyl-CoA thioesterase I
VLAGMEAPPHLGSEYTEAFRAVYRDLAREENVTLIPFLLDRVAGQSEFNQPDGIHPNEAGARLVAENVWASLEPLLEKG